MTPATPKLVRGVIPKGSDFGLKALVGWNGLDPKGLAGVFGVADTELILVGSRGGQEGGGSQGWWLQGWNEHFLVAKMEAELPGD